MQSDEVGRDKGGINGNVLVRYTGEFRTEKYFSDALKVVRGKSVQILES